MLSRWRLRVRNTHARNSVTFHNPQCEFQEGMCNVAGKATRTEGNTEVEAAKVMPASCLLSILLVTMHRLTQRDVDS